MTLLKQEIAECAGLWLAEGDSKTEKEITFTNNSLDLILFFKEVIEKIYKGKNKPRLYTYSPVERQLFTKLDGFKKVKFYADRRANRPYYIYRLADTIFVREWKVIVGKIIDDETNFDNILRGIFAGEGNVKYNEKHNSRAIRIASKNRYPLIEKLLKPHKIRIIFEERTRQYIINACFLNEVKSVKIAELHPVKGARFNVMMDSLLETHYAPGELKSILLKDLEEKKTVKQLAKKFKRKGSRVSEVLQELKEEGKVDYLRNNKSSFWMFKEKKEEMVRNEAKKILSYLQKSGSYAMIGEKVNLGRKTIRRRFKNYEKEGLINQTDGWWKLTETGEKLVCGVDEAGSEVN